MNKSIKKNLNNFHVRARAPLRIGLAGGGTDINTYFLKYGGEVLNATIRKYAFAELKATEESFFAESLEHNISFSLKENLSNIPKELKLHFAAYETIVKDFNNGNDINCKLSTYCDVPIGSGLGSSSTLVVAILKAFSEALNLGLDDYELAKLAYHIERNICKFSGGMQDQFSASFGGFNFMEFRKDNVIVNQLRIKNWFRCELESSFLLHFTGISRESLNVIKDQKISITNSNEDVLNQLHLLKKESKYLKEAILKCDRKKIVNSINRGWKIKSRTSKKITNKLIEERIIHGLKNGAQAAKVSGAGGGGFILFMCEPSESIILKKSLMEFSQETYLCSFTDSGAEAWKI